MQVGWAKKLVQIQTFGIELLVRVVYSILYCIKFPFFQTSRFKIKGRQFETLLSFRRRNSCIGEPANSRTEGALCRTESAGPPPASICPHQQAIREPMDCGLVQFAKIFKIPRHIESLVVCMKH